MLELGSGTGVSGLLVSLLRPSEVVITDLPQCLPLIQRNVAEMAQVAAAEGASVSPISVEPCAWGEPLSFANARFDVIRTLRNCLSPCWLLVSRRLPCHHLRHARCY